MLKHTLLTTLALFALSTTAVAQLKLAHEVGIIFGPVAMQSDFGQKSGFNLHSANTGFGIGFVHFLNFSAQNDRAHFFSEHFKLRSELSFNKTSFKDLRTASKTAPTATETQQLAAITGSSTVLNLGAQVEYSPFMTIHDFENTIGSFSPYISLGFLLSYYSATVSSSLGKLGTPEATPQELLSPSEGHAYGFSSEGGISPSATASIGIHYKLTKMSDLMFESRIQLYNSDWIDGINPNPSLYTQNKSKDWQAWFNVGYIYYLEF
jgi:hypothetical protein